MSDDTPNAGAAGNLARDQAQLAYTIIQSLLEHTRKEMRGLGKKGKEKGREGHHWSSVSNPSRRCARNVNVNGS